MTALGSGRPARVLVIDNYDSFVYNLVQYLAQLGAECVVRRNDAVSAGELGDLAVDGVLISPGPGAPAGAGVSMSMVSACAERRLPLLGVCLGHQAIGQAYGGKVVRARRVMHGKTSQIEHGGKGVFRGLPAGFLATRYHSLVIENESVPSCLEVTARSEDGEIMGVRHRQHFVEGVQFHPEAVLTEHGHRLLNNFLQGRGE